MRCLLSVRLTSRGVCGVLTSILFSLIFLIYPKKEGVTTFTRRSLLQVTRRFVPSLLRTQSVGLFRTHTDKVCLIC